MHKAFGRAFIAVVLVVAATAAAFAADRVALVIGNSDYGFADQLSNPRGDAEDMAALLESIGYEVVRGFDVNAAGMRNATREFGSLLADADTALFYYSGHGVQSGSVSYLIPVDARIESESDLVFDGLPIQDILRVMESSALNSVVILDSYRNKPERRGSAGAAGLQVKPGIAALRARPGGYVAMAAQPGEITLQGDGRNSPFTSALLKVLGTAGADIDAVMAEARQEVIAATGNRQAPWLNGALSSRFSINAGSSAPATVVAKDAKPDPVVSEPESADESDREREAWEAIVESTEVDDFLDFLVEFPDGLYASTARVQIKRLARAQGGGTRNDNDQERILPDSPAIGETQLTIETQRELIRVGCLSGQADGDWGPRSRRALSEFAERTGMVASLDPEPELLDSLRQETQRVCPLVCGPREIASGDRCVAKTCRAGQELLDNGQCRKVRVVREKPRADPPRRKAEPAPVRQAAPPKRKARTPCSAAVKGLPGYDYCE